MSYNIFIPLKNPEKKHVSLLLRAFRGAWPQGCFDHDDLEQLVRLDDLQNSAWSVLQPPCEFEVYKQTERIFVRNELDPHRMHYIRTPGSAGVEVTAEGIYLFVRTYGSTTHSEVAQVAARFQRVLQRHTRSVGNRVHVF